MGSVAFNEGQVRVSRSNACLRKLALVFFMLVASGPAHAIPFIPFDAVDRPSGLSFGFVDPRGKGIDTPFREFTEFRQAAPTGSAEAANSLLLVDPVSDARCPPPTAGCSVTHHVIEIFWDITFRADQPGQVAEVDLLLVDSDFRALFAGNAVSIDYGSASLDGVPLELQTASLNDGSYYFIDFVLGAMRDGETKRVGFRYQVEGALPLSPGGEVALAFPVILPGAYVYNPVPEPGTASMLGLGLVVLAVRRRRF